MSVSSILTSLTSQVSTLLGGDWSELDYIYDLEANSARSSEYGYGVGSESGASVSGINKAVTLDFDFFVVLTRGYKNRSSDTKEREVLSEIYDQLETISKNIFQKKLNNSSVLLVSNLAYSSPEKIDDKTISVRVDFTIKFLNRTT